MSFVAVLFVLVLIICHEDAIYSEETH